MADGTTQRDTNYIRSKFAPKSSFQAPIAGTPKAVSAPDFLDPDYQRAMLTPVPGSDVPKPGNYPLTSIAYGAHGTSSTYWLFLAANGFVSWIGLREGVPFTVVDVTPLMTTSQYPDHSLSSPTAKLTQMEI